MGLFNLQPVPIEEFALFIGAATPGISAIVRSNSPKKTFQITITGAATIKIEASNDGTNFQSVYPGVTASALIADQDPWKFYRAQIISILSGTVTVLMRTGA